MTHDVSSDEEQVIFPDEDNQDGFDVRKSYFILDSVPAVPIFFAHICT